MYKRQLPYHGPIVANVMHDRGRLLAAMPGNMKVDFAADAVRVDFDLPNTGEGRDARELIRAGVLSALSAEFSVEEERWEGPRTGEGVRVIKRGTLYGLGLVAQPAYPGSVLDPSRSGSLPEGPNVFGNDRAGRKVALGDYLTVFSRFRGLY